MRIVTSRPPARHAASKASVPPSAQARFTLALAGGKAAGTASRVLRAGGGTSFPGMVARRIDPRILQKTTAVNDASKAGRHREQRQDDDLPDARRAGTGRRPVASPRTGPVPTCCRE